MNHNIPLYRVKRPRFFRSVVKSLSYLTALLAAFYAQAPSIAKATPEAAKIQHPDLDSDALGSTHICAPSERFYRDDDGDGFGVSGDYQCSPAADYTMALGDCDDGNAAIHPGAHDSWGDALDGDCGGGDGPQPHLGLSTASASDFGPDLAAALGALGEGETLWVGPGLYTAEGIVMDGGQGEIRSTHGANLTTWEGQSTTRLLNIDGGDWVLAGFTLRGGFAGIGGAILAQNPASLTLESLHFVENQALVDGGALFVAQGDDIRLENLAFEGNSAGGRGGALTVMGAQNLAMAGLQFRDNQSRWGGGMALAQIRNAQVQSLHFDGNYASQAGGGLHLTQNCPGEGQGHYSALSFTQNRSGEMGGGVYLAGCTAGQSLSDWHLAEGEAQSGGGIYLKGAAHFEDFAFFENHAQRGGGLFVHGDGQIALTGSDFRENQAQLGGAAFLDGNAGKYSQFFAPQFEANGGGDIISLFHVDLETLRMHDRQGYAALITHLGGRFTH